MGLVVSVWHVQAHAAEFEWRAPPGCPEAADVQSQIEEALGTNLSEAVAAKIVVFVQERADGSFELRLSIDGNLRVIQAQNCFEAGRAAAVAASLALEARKRDSPVEPSSVNQRAPALPVAEPFPTSGPESQAAGDQGPARKADDRAHDLVFGVSAGGLLDIGSLPNPAPGFELGVALSVASFAARLSAAGFPEQTTVVSGSAGGDFALITAALGLCVQTVQRSFGAAACLGGEIGQLHGRGAGVSRPREGGALWVMPQGGLELQVPLGVAGLAAWGGPRAGVPLFRDEFNLGGVGVVHRPKSVVFRLAAGVSFTF